MPSIRQQFVAIMTLFFFAGGVFPASWHALMAQAPELRKARRMTSSPIDQFIEVSKNAGINFTLSSGGPDKRYIIEAKGGGGIAWIDYDKDGFPDLFFVNGSAFENWRRGTSPPSRLFHNNGDGTFADASAGSGLNHVGWGMG